MKKIALVLLSSLSLACISPAFAVTPKKTSDVEDIVGGILEYKSQKDYCKRHPKRCEREQERREYKREHRSERSEREEWCDNNPRKCRKWREQRESSFCERYPWKCD